MLTNGVQKYSYSGQFNSHDIYIFTRITGGGSDTAVYMRDGKEIGFCQTDNRAPRPTINVNSDGSFTASTTYPGIIMRIY